MVLKKNKSVILFYVSIVFMSFSENALGELSLDTIWTARLNYSRSSTLLDEEKDFYGMTYEADSKLALSRTFLARFEAKILSAQASRGGNSDIMVKEGYIQWRQLNYDISLGKQIIAWGKADAINPTDIVSPRDYTSFLPFDDDQRRGVDSMKMDYYLSESLLTSLTFVMEHEASTIIFPNHFLAEIEINDDVAWNDPQMALSISQFRGNFDWAMYYFNGHSLKPGAFTIDNIRERPNEPLFLFWYAPMQMYGFDITTVKDRYSYHFEYAQYQYKTFSQYPLGLPDQKAWIMGIKRSFTEYLNMTLQYVVRRKNNDDLVLLNKDTLQDAELSLIQEINNFISETPRSVNHNITWRIANAWQHDRVRAELFINQNLNDKSRFIQSTLYYDYTDAIKLSTGFKHYQGNSKSIFGIMEKNNNVFFETRYSF